MTAWLVQHPDDDRRQHVLVAFPNSMGQPCLLLDETAAPIVLTPHRPMGTADWSRHLDRERARLDRIDEVFSVLIRRYG